MYNKTLKKIKYIRSIVSPNCKAYEYRRKIKCILECGHVVIRKIPTYYKDKFDFKKRHRIQCKECNKAVGV